VIGAVDETAAKHPLKLLSGKASTGTTSAAKYPPDTTATSAAKRSLETGQCNFGVTFWAMGWEERGFDILIPFEECCVNVQNRTLTVALAQLIATAASCCHVSCRPSTPPILS
jgi:hypothetical protein